MTIRNSKIEKAHWFSIRPQQQSALRFPQWLRRPIPQQGLDSTQQILADLRLNTVCEEARCPNRLECHSSGTATFLAMGHECTRNCGFCDISHSQAPASLEEDEPLRIAEAIDRLKLKHAVITMVARDDLSDQGAGHLVQIIHAVRQRCSETSIEVLTSDFSGNLDLVRLVLDAKPDIFNHNIETVRRLSPRIRHKATYDRSLEVLRYARSYAPTLLIKSGMMLGLGEVRQEVLEAIEHLHLAGCNSITIGQYLQPSHRKLQVKRFITPEEFQEYRTYGESLGVHQMFCGPFVRSSYHAGEEYQWLTNKN
jgi:lipoic acid synthetase